jgi:hypothetical protein
MKAIMDVVIARNTSNLDNQWECLITLYYISPEVVQKELEKNLSEIIGNLANIKVEGYDPARMNRASKQANYAFKKQNADKVFHAIIASLQKNHYYEIELGAKPKYQKKGHLG